jgi:hypothetical protein
VKGACYTIPDLECIVLNTAKSDVSTETELVQYYCQFRPIAVWLVANAKISVHKRDRYFWQGLPQSARLAIAQRLQHTETNYTHNEVQTKRVAFSHPAETPKTKLDELDELAQKMHRLDIRNAAYSVCYMRLAYLAPTAAQVWPAPKIGQAANVNAVSTANPLPYLPLPPASSPSHYQPNATCFFCGGSHVMRACPTAGEYLRAGRIIRDGQYFAFPDRSRLRHFGNETFKQAIDARYSVAPPATPATGANSTPINTTRMDPSPQLSTEIPTTTFISESYFLQCEPVVENHIIVTVQDSSDEDYQSDINAVTRSKAKASAPTESESDSNPKLPKVPQAHPPAIEPALKYPAVESKKPPVFTYESKAANPDAIQHVFKGILDVTIPNITVADLLAISPELRKEAVEHCRTH